MTKPRALNDRSLAYKVVGTQAFVAVIVPILFLYVGKDAALCALTGGWIATLSNAYFAIQAFRYSGARTASKMVQSFYRGEAGKFIITIVLITLVFKEFDMLRVKQNALSFFLAFISVHMVAWFAPLVLKK